MLAAKPTQTEERLRTQTCTHTHTRTNTHIVHAHTHTHTCVHTDTHTQATTKKNPPKTKKNNNKKKEKNHPICACAKEIQSISYRNQSSQALHKHRDNTSKMQSDLRTPWPVFNTWALDTYIVYFYKIKVRLSCFFLCYVCFSPDFYSSYMLMGH